LNGVGDEQDISGFCSSTDCEASDKNKIMSSEGTECYCKYEGYHDFGGVCFGPERAPVADNINQVRFGDGFINFSDCTSANFQVLYEDNEHLDADYGDERTNSLMGHFSCECLYGPDAADANQCASASQCTAVEFYSIKDSACYPIIAAADVTGAVEITNCLVHEIADGTDVNGDATQFTKCTTCAQGYLLTMDKETKQI
jgi:hypothetical protein